MVLFFVIPFAAAAGMYAAAAIRPVAIPRVPTKVEFGRHII
jgi:hypothetical protein